MTEADLRERVEKFVRATPRDAVDHLLVAFFMNAIREDSRGPLGCPSKRERLAAKRTLQNRLCQRG